MQMESWKYPAAFKGLGLSNAQIAHAVEACMWTRAYLRASKPKLWRDEPRLASAALASGLDPADLGDGIGRALEVSEQDTVTVIQYLNPLMSAAGRRSSWAA